MSNEHTSHEIQPARPDHEPSKGGVSRRSFVRLAVGALTALPTVAGGVLVGAPASALAEEAAQGEDGVKAMADAISSGVITVMAVRYDEVCVSVLDMTDGRKSAKPVAGAKVKITSYYNKKSVEVTTDKNGLAVARVADLAEDEPKKENICTFSAYIEMSAPGYRIFKTGRATLTGGRGLELATMRLEEGVPYPSRVTFDDWDVLYTNHGFCSAESNKLRHKLQIELEGLASWRQLTVKLMDNKDRTYAEGTVMPSGDRATVSMNYKFLQQEKGNEYALPIGGAFLVRFFQEGVEYAVPLSLIVCLPGAKEDSGLLEDTIYKLQPFSDIQKSLEFRIPVSCGPFAGVTIRLLPTIQLPVGFVMSYPLGLFGFSMNVTGLLNLFRSEEVREKNKNKWTSFIGYKTVNGKKDPDGWGFHATEIVIPEDAKYPWTKLNEALRYVVAQNAPKYNARTNEILQRLGLESWRQETTTPYFNYDNSNNNGGGDNNSNNGGGDNNGGGENNSSNNNGGGDNNNSSINSGNSSISGGGDDSLRSQSEWGDQALVPAGEGAQWLVPMDDAEEEKPSNLDYGFQLSFWVNVLGRYVRSVDLYQLTGNLAANVNAFASYTIPFVALGIPFFFSIEVGCDVTLAFGFYAVTPELLSFSKYSWDPGTQGQNLFFTPRIVVTFGIGVKGFASIAAFGHISFPFVIGHSIGARNADNKNLPEAAVGKTWHVTIGASFKCGIYVQCFLFYVEFTFKPWNDATWYDNWRDDEGVSAQQELEAQAARELEELQAMSLGELLDDPRTTSGIVTEGALGDLAEFAGSYDDQPQSLVAQSEGAGGASQDAGVTGASIEQVPVEMEDGSTVTVPVIRLNVYNPEPSSADGGAASSAATKTSTEANAAPRSEELVSEGAVAATTAMSQKTSRLSEASVASDDSELQPTEGTPQQAAPGQQTEEMGTQEVDAGQPSGDPGQTGEMGTQEVDAGQPSADPGQQPGEMGTQETDPGQQPAQEGEGAKSQTQAQGTAPRPAMFGGYVPLREQISAQAEEYPGVKGLGHEGGFVPSVDRVFAREVFSDPRAKIVEIEGVPHVFRLASVRIRYDGRDVYRTRVVCQQIDPSAKGIGSQVFDVPNNTGMAAGVVNSWMRVSDLRRENCFDYDFDVSVQYLPNAEKDFSGFIHLVVISGEREQGDQSDLSTVLSHQAFGYAAYKFGGTDKIACSLYTWVWASSEGIRRNETRTNSWPHHSFGSPQVVVADPDPNWNDGESIYALFSVLDFASENKQDVLNRRAGETGNYEVDYYVFGVMGGRYKNGDPFTTMFSNTGYVDVGDKTITGMSLSEALPNTEAVHLLQLFGENETYAVLTDLRSALFGYIVSKMRRVSFPDSSGEVDYKSARLIPWRSGSYIANVKAKPTDPQRAEDLGEKGTETRIYRVDLVNASGKPVTSIDQDAKLVFTSLGLDGHGIRDFCIHPSGDTIFWPVAREDVPVMKQDENGELYDTGETESYYAIKACDFWSDSEYLDDNVTTGEFRDPYVFAEVSHRMDTLTLSKASVGGSEEMGVFRHEAVNFISSEILDVTKGKGNVWLTRVPVACCLTVISIEAVSRIVLPGQEAEVLVGVRNDGNYPIFYFEAQVCRTDGTVLFERTLLLTHSGDEPNPLQESKWNPRKTDGTLEGDIYDGWLPPGKCGLYKLTFPVPDEWEDRIDIVVRIKSLEVPGENTVSPQGGLAAMAEDVKPLTYIEVLEDEPTETLTVSTEFQVTSDAQSPAPVTVTRPGDGGDAGAGGDGGSGAGGGSGSAGRTGLPRTADDSRGMGALGLAAAALGSGMVAYSKRRTKLEEEREEE